MLGFGTKVATAAASVGLMLSASANVVPTKTQLAPGRTTLIVQPETHDSRATRVEEATDGLYYLTAKVNGVPVRFLIDTGASVVTLTPADAAAIGVGRHIQTSSSRMLTANGASLVRWTRLDAVEVAGQNVENVEALVPQSGLPVSLLGQNLLSRLGELSLKDGHLELRARGV